MANIYLSLGALGISAGTFAYIEWQSAKRSRALEDAVKNGKIHLRKLQYLGKEYDAGAEFCMTRQDGEMSRVVADWTQGVRNKSDCTPDGLRASAKLALKSAAEWVETAEQLIAKAEDLSTEQKVARMAKREASK